MVSCRSPDNVTVTLPRPQAGVRLHVKADRMDSCGEKSDVVVDV